MSAKKTTMMRVRSDLHEKIRQLAADRGCTMQEIIHEAVESYRRQLIFDEAHAAYAALRADPEKWEEYQEELRSIGA